MVLHAADHFASGLRDVRFRDLDAEVLQRSKPSAGLADVTTTASPRKFLDQGLNQHLLILRKLFYLLD
jgi:hypothetical protein